PPRPTRVPYTTLFRSHVRLHDLPALLVRRADDGAFGDVGVRQKRRLHFRPGDVVAGRDDHVVGARNEVEDAVRVAHEVVAGDVRSEEHTSELQSPYDL